MFSTTKLYASAIYVVAKNEENSTKAEPSAKLKPSLLKEISKKGQNAAFWELITRCYSSGICDGYELKMGTTWDICTFLL